MPEEQNYFYRFIFRNMVWNFDFDLVQISTPYPGATAEEIETLVTLPIENGIKNLEGIDEIWSVSVEGMSIVTIQLDPDSKTKRKDVRAIEREIETVRISDLPEDGDEPNEGAFGPVVVTRIIVVQLS